MSRPQLSILVVNYRQYDLLRECLQSICASRLSDYEIIVIDNEADPGQASEIRKEFPGIVLEDTPENPGYAGGNNRALELSTGEFVFLLNNDATVDPSASNDALKEFYLHKEIAALQPLILFQQDHGKVNNCGLEVQFLGYAWDRGFKQSRELFQKGHSLSVFSGAGVILRKAAVEAVGLFDPDFFLYHEDVDLSLRLRHAGYQLLFTPSFVVYHRYSFKRDAWRYFYLERNRWFTVIKNYPLLLMILMLPAAVFMEFGVLIYSLFGGWSKEKIRSWGAVIKALPRLLKQRRSNRKEISTREFIAGMKGGVEFLEVNSPVLRFIANPILEIYWLIVKALVGSLFLIRGVVKSKS